MNFIPFIKDPKLTQDAARHQAFTRAMTFHLKNPLESNSLTPFSSFDLSLAVGTRAMKFVLVLDLALFLRHSSSFSWVNESSKALIVSDFNLSLE